MCCEPRTLYGPSSPRTSLDDQPDRSDAIVLGGGLSGITALYRQVPRLWEQYIFSDMLPPVHGDSSGVRGAAWLWREGEEA